MTHYRNAVSANSVGVSVNSVDIPVKLVVVSENSVALSVNFVDVSVNSVALFANFVDVSENLVDMSANSVGLPVKHVVVSENSNLSKQIQFVIIKKHVQNKNIEGITQRCIQINVSKPVEEIAGPA